MNCQRIQEFIITDYIDGQMGDIQKGFIDHHLAHCRACSGYLKSIKKEAINPFVNAPKKIPHELLWSRIKGAIEYEQWQYLEKSLKIDFWESFRSAVHIPKPALIFATILTMIFMIGPADQLFFSSPVVHINGQDQVEYLSSLINEPGGLAGNTGNESQTPIEQYFL